VSGSVPPRPRRGVWVVLLATLVACRADPPIGLPLVGAPPEAGAVVSEHPLATAVGVAILERGGNAADAAVASALALAVVFPQAGNLGGGGFVLWVPEEGDPATLDFREIAPAGYEARLYLDEAGEVVRERSRHTPLAVGVPGTPAGLFDLFRRFGSKRFSFPELCAPAIELARGGFQVDPWLAQQLRRESIRTLLTRDPASAALFYPGGEPLAEGQRFVQPKLGDTLQRYARGGAEAFYRGATAEAILDGLRAADLRAGGVTRGGEMTLADLADYQVQPRRPLSGWFRGHQVIGMGPPGSGGVVLLQVLGILDGFPIDAEREHTFDRAELGLSDAGLEDGISARALHWWIEALRCAFADRAEHLGDPDRHPVPLAQLLSAEWIAERRVGIGERSNPDVGAMVPPPAPESSETTHLSVVDRQGNAVSLTTTLNGSFGSGILAADAGFLLNNELDDFSIRAGTPNMFGLVGGAANQLMPGKRPLSSMTPTVVRDAEGHVQLVLGAPGGPRIITAVTQVLLRVLAYDQSLEQAVHAPRLHQQWRPALTRFEEGWEEPLIVELREVHGQEIEVTDRQFGSVQAIRVHPDGRVEGVSDPRRGGMAGIEGRPLPEPRRPPE